MRHSVPYRRPMTDITTIQTTVVSALSVRSISGVYNKIMLGVGWVNFHWHMHFCKSTVFDRILAPEWFTISRGADRGSRAPPLWLNPMHILLYPRDFSSRKIMLTGENLGYRVFTSRLFKDTQIRHTEKKFRDRGNWFSHNFVVPVPILACLVLKCSQWSTLSAGVTLLLII